MKKLMFYCQHVLGMGHLIRSLSLIQGLAQDFQVIFVNGGEPVSEISFPVNVEVHQLPPLSTNEDFKTIQVSDGEEVAVVQAARASQLRAAFDCFQPDLLVIELFPFGRKKFAFELLPLLAHIRLERAQETCRTQVVCSLRDILVTRPDQAKYEAQVCDTLNRYFDLLLVHSDPAFQPLDESFGLVGRIQIPVQYTGYVVQPERPNAPDLSEMSASAVEPGEPVALDAQQPLLLASIGGGRVGAELLAATIQASAMLYQTWPHQLLIFTGPYIPDQQFADLQSLAVPHAHVILRRFTVIFTQYMAKAALSISMAGYNTCMNLLTTGVPALLLPFTGGNNDEQSTRADKLAALGLVGVLQPSELEPVRLAERILAHLKRETATLETRFALKMNGVAESHAALQRMVQPANSHRLAKGKQHGKPYEAIFARMRPTLERLASEGKTVDFFLRDDDTDDDNQNLRHLLDLALAHNTPISLAVIPGTLTRAGISCVHRLKKACPTLIELHQHGWMHLNHETTGRKCEFGASRSLTQQLDDIANGKRVMEESFLENFFPAFTPPWNRCTNDTFAALNQLGFVVLSKDRTLQPVSGYRFRELSISIDLLHWKEGVRMTPPETVIDKLIQQLNAGHPIGLLSHHKVMNEEAFAFLGDLLGELNQQRAVRFHTLQSLSSPTVFKI